jgi:multiple sugar transport system substrate-binding protein
MAEPYPMRQAILDALKTAAPRPKTPTYQNVSTLISAALSPPASIDPPATLDELREQITDALESKGVLP